MRTTPEYGFMPLPVSGNRVWTTGEGLMDLKNWAEETAGKICRKERAAVERNRGRIPYTAENGRFDDWSEGDRITWWTNGFYGGLLWQLYHAFGDPVFRDCAEEIEEKLDRNFLKTSGMDHDSGFKWLPTSGANYLVTGSPASKNRLILAASDLAGRINLRSGLIRAWNDEGDGSRAGWAIIDTMMNLPLLYRVSEMIHDPRFRAIAELHADHAIKAFLRPDGSAHHIVTFDPESGEIIEALGGQGMAVGSSWTRGQAWALYGFGLSFRHTGKESYLAAARNMADYVLRSIPESGLIPVDFCQPQDCGFEDSTAAAIFSCGLLELSEAVREKAPEKSEACRDAAAKLLRVLAGERCLFDADHDNLLVNCSAAYHAEKHNFPIIYGDYFFTEAILRLCGKELFIW